MNFYQNKLIRSMLVCFNPRFNMCNNHYVCGRNLALFGSLAQVENCLTSTTSKCKGLVSSCNNLVNKK